MQAEILQLGAVGIIFIFFLKEFFAYLKAKKNGENGNGNYKIELQNIDNKLSNHLTEVNSRMSDIERGMTEIRTDIAIIKNSLNDIKVAIK